MDKVVTAAAPSNIAFVKYWGNRNEKLILPYNSSISMTLSMKDSTGAHFRTVTSVVRSVSLKTDVFYMNGQLRDLRDKEFADRFRVVDQLRKIAKKDDKVLVVSENSFPTAAGLASSASGIAALVYATAKALGLELSEKELSVIARSGSGSACRSLCGGFVVWNKGKKPDGSDSYAQTAFPAEHWPDIVDLVAIVSEAKKKISSRGGMRQTVQTSPLYKQRLKFAERNVELAVDALRKKDFHNLAKVIMQDSDNMHAVMMDTFPPIMYLNDTSKEIIESIIDLNALEKEAIAAYTFDAGPNAQIITTRANVAKVRNALSRVEGIERFIQLGVGEKPEIISGESLITPEIMKNM